jgi:DHA3 family macrolide efflux protein-like MFS transporter
MATGENQRNSYIVCLTNPDFLKFYAGQYISFIGDRLAQLAFMTLLGVPIAGVAARGGEAGTKVNFLFVFSITPYILMFAISGYLIDRFRRRNVMIVCAVVQGALAIATSEVIRAFGFDGVADWFVYLSVFLIYCNAAVFNPAKYALIPELIDEEHLLAANALNSSTATISTLIGTFLGAAMLTSLNRVTGSETSGVVWALYLDSLTFFVPALLLWLVTSDLRRPRKRDIGAPSVWAQLAEGFHYLWYHRAVFYLFGVVGLMWFIAGFFWASLNVLMLDTAGANIGTYAIVVGTIGIGMFTGAIITGLTCRNVSPRKVTMVALIVTGALLLLTGVTLRLPSIRVASLFVTVAFAGAVIVTNDTLFQKMVPNLVRGRIFAINFLLSNICLLAAFGGQILVEKWQLAARVVPHLPSALFTTQSISFQLIGILALIGGFLVTPLSGSPLHRRALRARRVERSKN